MAVEPTRTKEVTRVDHFLLAAICPQWAVTDKRSDDPNDNDSNGNVFQSCGMSKGQSKATGDIPPILTPSL